MWGGGDNSMENEKADTGEENNFLNSHGGDDNKEGNSKEILTDEKKRNYKKESS